MQRERARLVTGVAEAAVVLGVVSTLAVAALSGAFPRSGPAAGQYPAWAPSAGCEVPSLPGTVVSAQVTEMGGMRGGPNERGPWMGDWDRDGATRKSHVRSDDTDWRLFDEGVIRSSVRKGRPRLGVRHG